MKSRASSSSSQSLRRSTSLAAAAASSMDGDGFVPIARGPMKKVGSKQSMGGENGGPPSTSFPARPKALELRRSQSQPAGMPSIGGNNNSYTIPSPSKGKQLFSNGDPSSSRGGAPTLPTMPAPRENGLTAEECEAKAKAILKEYFVGGDTADAILSIHELIDVGNEGSIERGAKVVEAGTLLVMEMKDADVKKVIAVMEGCVQQSKIESESIIKGLSDPLEFLGDIEIDAPLAGKHLARIVAKYIELKAITLDFLKDGPAYFLSDGKPAAFAINVLKISGDGNEGPDGGSLEVVDSLMTEDDRAKYGSAKAMFDAA